MVDPTIAVLMVSPYRRPLPKFGIEVELVADLSLKLGCANGNLLRRGAACVNQAQVHHQVAKPLKCLLGVAVPRQVFHPRQSFRYVRTGLLPLFHQGLIHSVPRRLLGMHRPHQSIPEGSSRTKLNASERGIGTRLPFAPLAGVWSSATTIGKDRERIQLSGQFFLSVYAGGGVAELPNAGPA